MTDAVTEGAAWKILQRDIDGGALTHAYAVISPDADALAEFLRRAGAAAVCESAVKPCLKCSQCVRAAAGVHPDIFTLPREAGKKILTDDIAALIEDDYIKPLEAARKVYVLQNFCESPERAQNKLLKILEEPMGETVFFLGVKKEASVLPTVLSRVKKLYIDGGEGIIARTASEGLSAEIAERVSEMFRDMSGSADIFGFVTEFSRFKDGETLLNILELYVRDIMTAASGREDLILFKTKKGDIIEAAGDYGADAAAGILGRIAAVKRNLPNNVNLTFMLDGLLYGILEERYKRC